MSRYKVLVDSSVWIEYFKSGNPALLDGFIAEDLICTNELILTELGPFLKHRGRNDIWESLFTIENIPLNIEWEGIRQFQLMNLQNGINKVGIPDLIILQQVLVEKITLFSFDKHFRLMNSYLKYELIF